MKPVFRLTAAITTWLTAFAVQAHPGHAHVPGPAHGFAWVDVALFLLAAVVVPTLAWDLVRRRNRRR